MLELSVLCLPEDKQKSLNFPLRFPLIIKIKKRWYRKGKAPFFMCFKGTDSKKSKR